MTSQDTIPELNKKVAQYLFDKSDKMEKAGKPPFRFWAYRKAGKSIRQETRNLWGVYRSLGLKGLVKIDGVGKKIAWEIVKQVERNSGKK